MFSILDQGSGLPGLLGGGFGFGGLRALELEANLAEMTLRRLSPRKIGSGGGGFDTPTKCGTPAHEGKRSGGYEGAEVLGDDEISSPAARYLHKRVREQEKAERDCLGESKSGIKLSVCLGEDLRSSPDGSCCPMDALEDGYLERPKPRRLSFSGTVKSEVREVIVSPTASKILPGKKRKNRNGTSTDVGTVGVADQQAELPRRRSGRLAKSSAVSASETHPESVALEKIVEKNRWASNARNPKKAKLSSVAEEPSVVGPSTAESRKPRKKVVKKGQVVGAPAPKQSKASMVCSIEAVLEKKRRGRPKGSKTKLKEAEAKATGRRKVAPGKGKFSKNSRRVFKTSSKGKPSTDVQPGNAKRRSLSKVVFDGVEFCVGDDVYVRNSDGSCSESETEIEECQVCGKVDAETMLECDSCLAGFHLTCLNPPLEDVPENDWVCHYCGRGERPPKLQNAERRHRSAREMLLVSDLWAGRIEQIWREADGSLWFRARWFLIPEETALGRQDHNGRRELFRSSEFDDNQMDTILRHCYVMTPEDFKKSTREGDDVFFCEYEYNERWCKFKRIEYSDDNDKWSDSEDEAYGPSCESEDEEGDTDDEESRKPRSSRGGKECKHIKTQRAANKRVSYAGGIEEVGTKKIPIGLRKGPQTDLEKAKAALALSAVPPSLPCRDRERKEIAAFLKDSVSAGEQCLGRCLYISGVPGTGKTATVLEVIKELGRKVDKGDLPSFRFVEINGLRLPSPEHAYTVLHEALTGQHVGWKRALQALDDRFANSKALKGLDARPCVLLVDELDLLVTRNQSVLYNIFDWPTRPHAKLIVIGIANTMDLPERMLPRIASRLGLQRVSFSPYSHKQLEEILSARLDGVRVFDKQASEFASRKVAAVSGDIRRALELCRRAVEVAEARLSEQSSADSSAISHPVGRAEPPRLQALGRSVVMADVDAAISEMFEAPQIQMMRRSAKLVKVFLVALVYEQRRTSMAETTFEKVAATCSELCASNGEECPDWDALLSIGSKLGAWRLVLCEGGARHRLQKIQLNFPCDDVSFALKKDEELAWLHKYL